MPIFALSFLLGILCATHDFFAGFIGLILLVFLLIIVKKIRQKSIKLASLSLLFLLAGFFSATWHINQTLNTKVEAKYLNTNLQIQGIVSEISQQTPQKTSFLLTTSKPFVANLKLSWYAYQNTIIPTLSIGQSWQLRARLKANNGFQNEAGYDYERYLFTQNIDATGYVRASENNKLIQQSNQHIGAQFKQAVSHKLLPLLLKFGNGGILYALISGDRKYISQTQWQRFINSNTSHLTVVSGLHIGLISGLAFWLSLLLYRRCASCCLRLPAPIFAAIVGIFAALAYALFAGFSVSSQRAFIMASMVFGNLIFRQNIGIWNLYFIALFLVLLLEPLSVLMVGFWLSFFAVGLIIYGVKHYQDKHKLWRIIFIQLIISVAMFPLLLWFFNAGSPVSFLANLLAVPVVSIITLPLSLLGAMFGILGLDWLASGIFWLGDLSLIFIQQYLDFLWQYTQFFWLDFALDSWVSFVLLLCGFGVLFLPRGLGLRRFSVLILLPIFLSSPASTLAKSQLELVIFDVGQGLAVLIKTQNQTLLYDTGFASRSGFNIGDAVILPYLKKHQIKHLDTVIISHNDNDHRGGFDAIAKATNIKQILASNPKKIIGASLCQTGQNWQADGVTFTLLNPPELLDKKGNNNSCVLKIDNGFQVVLLTGDIEKRAEKYLLKNHKNQLKSDVLLVPHHGSNTSSHLDFLLAVSPSIAINSSGFANRFSHPTPKVKQRYSLQNIAFYDTQCAGQINLLLDKNIHLKSYRKNHRAYWVRQC